MTTLYQLCEIDALDHLSVLRRGLERKEALIRLRALRSTYTETGLQWIIRRERSLAPQLARS